MPKVTFVGAGSAVFARQLMTDILAIDGLDDGVFALVDIDPTRLDLARRIAERLIELTGKRWRVHASTDRTELLKDSDYVINSIEVAGLKSVRPDYDIPLRYGVDQCIGDTIGPGGIFKALRTGPAWLDIVADVQRLAPRAVILNYTNPMSILTLAGITAVLVQMAFDHREIVDYAVRRLRSKVGYSSLGFQLLPSEFTISELQHVYEAVLGLSINRGNFWRKVVDRGVIEPTGKERNVRGKRAYLFRFTQQAFGLREEPDGFIEA